MNTTLEREVAEAVEDVCSVCQEHRNQCNGCQVRVDVGDVVVTASGITKKALLVEDKSELARVGHYILSCMKVCIAVIMLCSATYANEVQSTVIDVENLANAIYIAEGSVKYPYGIKSIDTGGDAVYARKICINTIRNNIKRYNKSSREVDYITFLGSRYCPVSAHELNKNWVSNVKKIYLAKTRARSKSSYKVGRKVISKHITRKSGSIGSYKSQVSRSTSRKGTITTTKRSHKTYYRSVSN